MKKDIINTRSKRDKVKLLNDTVKYFKTHKRSVGKKRKEDSYESCFYAGRNGAKGCAIGRLIADKKLCREFDRGEWPGVDNGYIFNSLPQKLQSYGQLFLAEVQNLHDTDDNWKVNDKGGNDLSERGKDFMKDKKESIREGLI